MLFRSQPIKNLQAKKEAKKKMVSDLMELIDSVFDEIQNSPGDRSRNPSRGSQGSRPNSANRGNGSGSAEMTTPHPMKAFIDHASEEEILNNQHYCYMCGSSTHLAKQCRVYTALSPPLAYRCRKCTLYHSVSQCKTYNPTPTPTQQKNL